MSRKSRLRGPFDKQHGKCLQALLNSKPQPFYHIQSLFPIQLSWEKALLLIYNVLVHLGNTLAVYENYPILNRDNLTIPIQMQLSEKEKTFSEFFSAFLKSTLNFKYFEKKVFLIDFLFSKLRTVKTWSYKCLKSVVSEDPSRSNMVNVPRHFWNLHQSTFIIFIDHCQVNWVRRNLSYWYAKSWDCLLANWILITGVLFLIATI